MLQRPVESTQYTSLAFGKRCKEMEASGLPWERSATPTTTPWPRASSPASKCELIERRSFKTKTEARLAVFTWIEAWYNPRRRHSAHGRISPVNFERMHADKLRQPPSVQHGLPTAGLCVAGATPAVDNPAPMLIET